MGFGGSDFVIRQKIGVWGEKTFLAHFCAHGEYGISAFEYGEASSKRRKAQGDAVCRPDLLLVDSDKVKALAQRGIHLDKMDLRAISDNHLDMQEIVKEALVAVEVKFSHREYRKGHVSFILDESRKARYEQWLSRTRGIGALMVWLTTDRAWIASVDQVLREGKEEIRTYEMRGGAGREKATWNFPVESAKPFATVTGYVLNKTFKPSLKMTESGRIQFDVNDDLGDFVDVDIPLLRQMAQAVRRP
jgi:hypothetical protein